MALPDPPEFRDQIPYFFQAVLQTPAGALPKGPLWIVVFDFDTNLRNTIKSVREYEPKAPSTWEIDEALDTITSNNYQSTKGCVLAQGVNIPGESLITNVEGLQYNGYIRSRVGLGRQDFDTLRIDFLNTNVSFVDNVIRPWAIMTGHLGMIVRPPEQKYRCNITIYRLGISSRDKPPEVIQQYNFVDACAIGVSQEVLSYGPEGNSIIKSAEFAYQWYTTASNKNPYRTVVSSEQRGDGNPITGTDFGQKLSTTTESKPSARPRTLIDSVFGRSGIFGRRGPNRLA